MGPSLAGASRIPIPRSTMPSGPSKDAPGLGRTQTTAATVGVKKEPKSEEGIKAEGDEEVYSEPDEGVEIVDMHDVRKMDWMAPETLKRESEYKKKVKPKMKKDEKKPLVEEAGQDQGEGLRRYLVIQRESDFGPTKIWISTNQWPTTLISQTL